MSEEEKTKIQEKNDTKEDIYNEFGKIDLIWLNNKKIDLVEVKFYNNSESLLRAILEIYTYYASIKDKEEFIKEFKEALRINGKYSDRGLSDKVVDIDDNELVLSLLVAEDQVNQFKDSNYNEGYKKILDNLNIKLYKLKVDFKKGDEPSDIINNLDFKNLDTFTELLHPIAKK